MEEVGFTGLCLPELPTLGQLPPKTRVVCWPEQTLTLVAPCAPLAAGYELRFPAALQKPHASLFCPAKGVFEVPISQ